MPAQSVAQTNFNAGELGPRMGGRPDLAAYGNGAAELTSFVPLVQGPVVKRPGTVHVATAASQTDAARLIGWTPRLTQAYVVEASPGKLRYFTNDAPVESSPGVPVETATPWSAADLARLNWQTSNDVIYLVDGVRALRRLTRTGASTFALDVPALSGGPFKDQNSNETIKVYADVPAGLATTLRATGGNVWQPGHVGSLFFLEAEDFRSIPAWEPGVTVIAADYRRSDGKVYECVANGRTGSIQPTHNRGTEFDGMSTGTDINGNPAGGVQWKFLAGLSSVLRITAYISPTEVQALIITPLPPTLILAVNASYRWAHAAFSDVEGWPSVVAIHNERLWLARGNRVWGSVVGDLLNFAPRTESGLVTADMAISIQLPSADDILWMEGDRVLLVGTATAEYAVGGVNNQAALSATNIAAQRQSKYGSAVVRPQGAGTRTLFVQRGGRKLRQMGYSFQADRYVSPDMTVRAHHITRPGIVQMAMQDEPESLLWALRSDGVLLALTFSEDEEVRGWSRQPVAGSDAAVESIATIPAPDGGSDQLWLAVRRTVNGVVRRDIERLAPFRDESAPLAEAIHLDASLTYSGAAASTFAGLQHLAGETVWALVNGAAIGPMTVNGSGSVTLPGGLTGTYVHIGLLFTARMVTMRLNAPAADGEAQGRTKKITRLIVRLLDALGLKVGGPEGATDEMILRPDMLAPAAALPPNSGDTSLPFPGGYDRNGVVVMESASPLPATILALFPAIDTGGQ